MMDRELRNNGGRVLQRVAGSETLTVTIDEHPIAELRPIPGARSHGGHVAAAVAPAATCRRAAAPG